MHESQIKAVKSLKPQVYLKDFFFIAGKAVLHISGRLKLQQDHPIINFPLFITFA